MFLVDGLDVLFRIALAILQANEEELLQCDSIPAVYVALESLPNRMWRPDKLLKVSALGGPARLSSNSFPQRELELRTSVLHNDIIKRRGAHVAALKDALNDT